MSNRDHLFQTNKLSQRQGNPRVDIKYQQQIVANQAERKGCDQKKGYHGRPETHMTTECSSN